MVQESIKLSNVCLYLKIMKLEKLDNLIEIFQNFDWISKKVKLVQCVYLKRGKK